MASRGASSKEIVTKKILETFPGSFINDKEIRIPMTESGEAIQLKCVLTCAKVNVENGAATAIPGETVSATPSGFPETAMNSPTNEEKERVKQLLEKLNL